METKPATLAEIERDWAEELKKEEAANRPKGKKGGRK